MGLFASRRQTEVDALLTQLGAARVTFRAGQVLQYAHQQPLGYFLLLEGSVLLTQEGIELPQARVLPGPVPRLLPELGRLEQPLSHTLLVERDATLWFFSRFQCQPGSFLSLCLEGLQDPGNPLFKIWSRYVATA